MSKPGILVTEPIPEKVIEYLQEFGEITIGERGAFNSEQNLKTHLPPYEGLMCMLSTPVTESVLQSATSLKVVANFAVGYNNIDIQAANSFGIKVATTPEVLTEACGDFAIALLMATTRRFNEAEKYLRQGKFKGWEPLGFLGMELRGKKLGVIGMGKIGQALAHRARAFGMKILYHNRNRVSSTIENMLQASPIETIEELASNSDVLSVNCPLTNETHHLINKRIFSLMPTHSILINISRGPVVDEEALANALHAGVIAGAGIDVFEDEPIVHPKLLSAPNCTLLPHIASATFETREAIGLLAARAIKQVLAGVLDEEIPNLVSN